MTRSDLCELLLTIVAAATDAETFLVGLTPDTFERLPSDDPRIYRAIKSAVSELGEAVKSLSPDLRARYPEVDWRGFAGLRDIVVHRYFALDLPRLWPVLKDEFPVVLTVVRAELHSSGKA
jgi:uncharacterized protein with HEPN domain